MKKPFVLAALLLSALIAIVPCFADEATDPATEAVTESVTDAPTEDATEDPTEAPIDVDELYEAEGDRDWLIEVIKKAKPDEVAFIRGYIEDALVSMEGLNYTDWEWAYKIVSDNSEWIACVIVGLGFIVAAVVAVVKFKREKALINNSVEAVGVSEREMKNMVNAVEGYDTTVTDLSKNIASVLARLEERDGELAKAADVIADRDQDAIRATKSDVDAMILLADVLDELIQLSNIPQIKKDAIYSKHETAKAAILKQMEGIKDEKPED